MSEQLPPQPLYIVQQNYDMFRIAQRTESGLYRTVCEMQGAFGHAEAALKLCDMMVAINEPLPLKQVGDKDK